MKVCTSCNISKDESQFNKQSSGRGGLRANCKQCESDYARNRRKMFQSRKSVPTPKNKYCSGCDATKSSKDFGVDSGTPDGLRNRCKNCEKVTYTEKGRGLVRRGITLAQYNLLFEAQGGVCAICKNPPKDNKRLHVDHDHSCCPGRITGCGKCVRGLLCFSCNAGIGALKDDPNIVSAAAQYLINNNKQGEI